jgi:hypothetical protein
MQLIPATWAQIAVDGDSDGVRDPQDIDDAALAGAVFLCAWHDDLATADGQRAAVLRYNHSAAYARLVLATTSQYAQSYEVSVAPVVLTDPDPAATEGAYQVDTAPLPGEDPVVTSWNDADDATWEGSLPSPSSGPSPSPAPDGTPTPTPAPTATSSPTEEPTAGPTPTTTLAPSPQPTTEPSSTVTPTPSPGADPSDPPTDRPTEPPTPPDQGAGDLSPAERQLLDVCSAALSAGTVPDLGTCLAEGLGLPPEDPRVVWILTTVVGLPPEQVDPSPGS